MGLQPQPACFGSITGTRVSVRLSTEEQETSSVDTTTRHVASSPISHAVMPDSRAFPQIRSALSLPFLMRLDMRLRKPSSRLTAGSEHPKTHPSTAPTAENHLEQQKQEGQPPSGDSSVSSETETSPWSSVSASSSGGSVRGGLSTRVREVASGSAMKMKASPSAAFALCESLVELEYSVASAAASTPEGGGPKCCVDQFGSLLSLCDIVTRGALLCCEDPTSFAGGGGASGSRYDKSLETLRMHVERAKELVAPLCSKGPLARFSRNKRIQQDLETLSAKVVDFASKHKPELATSEDVYERKRLTFLARRVKIPEGAPRPRGWFVPREQVMKDTCDRLGITSAPAEDGYEDLDDRQRVVGLSGLSGCGKSTVASMVIAREDVRGFFHDGIVWLSVGGKGAKDRLPALMLRLANMVHDTVLKQNHDWPLPPPRKPSVGADRQNGAAYIRGALGCGERCGGRQRRMRYLIVADDVYEPEVLEELQGLGASVLYTTTRSASSMQIGGDGETDLLRVEQMTDEEIGTVLRRACGLRSSDNLPQQAHDLMKSYGSQVMDVAYVGRWGIIFNTTDEEAWEMALRRIFVEGGEGGDPWTCRRWRTAVLFAGLADLGRLNGKQKHLYLSLAVLPQGLNFTPRDAAALLYGETCSAADLEAVVMMLASFERCSVLTLEEGGRYRMHSAHADFVLNRISSFPLSRKRALARWRKHMSTRAALFAWPVEDLVEIWRVVECLEEPGVVIVRPYDAVLAAMEQSGTATTEFAAALERVAQFHVVADDLEDAHAMYTRLVEIEQIKLSKSSKSRFDQEVFAEHLHRLGVLAAELDKLEEAEGLHNRSLSIRKEIHGANHPDVARSLQALAICASDTGKAEDEQRLLREAMSIWDRGASAGGRGGQRRLNPAHDFNFDAALVLQTLGCYALQQGRTTEAEELLGRALVSWDVALGDGHPNAARTLHSLGVCAYDRGRIEEARGLYLRALKIRKQRLGPRHPEVAATMHNLGVCEWKLGRIEEAESLYRQTLGIRVDELGGEDLQVASTLHSLGACARHFGRDREATGLYRRALKIRESKLGPAHPEVAATLHELGVSAFGEGKMKQAEDLLRRALAIKKDAGPGLDTAYTLHNLGGVLFASGGRVAEAQQLFLQALEIREKVGASLDAANTLQCLGECAIKSISEDDTLLSGEGSGNRSESSRKEAEGFYRRALEIQEEELGSNNLSVADTLFQLGQCLFSAEGKSEEALSLYSRSLAVREAKLGKDHEDVLLTLHQLGACACASGRIGQAEEWYGRALVLEESTLGAEHPTVARTLHRLGECAVKAGRIDEGIATLRRALAIPENKVVIVDGSGVVGEGHHLDVALTLQQLAVSAVDVGRTEDADALFREVLAVEEKIFGGEHLDVAGTLSNLGECALKDGRIEDATAYYQRALRIEEKLGADQASLGSTLHCLGRCAEQAGRRDEAEMFFRRSLRIEEEQMGTEHPNVAVTLADLGASALAAGRTAEAENMLKRALAITDKLGGEATLGCAGTLHCLAECARKSGRCDDAEGLLKRALAIEEEKGYRGIAGTMGRLGSWCYDDGRAEEAEDWFRKALVLEEQALGKRHRDVAATLGRLGKCLSSLNRTEEAAVLHRQALEIVEEQAGDRSLEATSVLLDIGLCALTMGRREEAEVLYRRAWMIEAEHLGPDHPDVMATARALEIFVPAG